MPSVDRIPVALVACDAGGVDDPRDRRTWAAALSAPWCISLWLGQPGRVPRRAPAEGLTVVAWDATRPDPRRPWQRAASLARVAGALRREQVGLVHVEDLACAPLFVVAARLLGRPCIVEVTAPHAHATLRRRGVGLADAVLFDSRFHRDAAAWPAAAVIPVAIDPLDPLSPEARERLRGGWGVRPGEVVIGVPGPLAPLQGCDLAVEAVAALRRQGLAVRLVFFGEDNTWGGRYRTLLSGMAGASGAADVVTFAGSPSGGPPPVQAVDVALGAPRTAPVARLLLDAWGGGVPAVVSRVGQAPEMVRHGEDGLLVAPEDVDDLVRALTTLVSEPTLRERLGSAARRRARAEYSAAQRANRLSALYEAVSSAYLTSSRPWESRRWTSSR